MLKIIIIFAVITVLFSLLITYLFYILCKINSAEKELDSDLIERMLEQSSNITCNYFSEEKDNLKAR